MLSIVFRWIWPYTFKALMSLGKEVKTEMYERRFECMSNIIRYVLWSNLALFFIHMPCIPHARIGISYLPSSVANALITQASKIKDQRSEDLINQELDREKSTKCRCTPAMRSFIHEMIKQLNRNDTYPFMRPQCLFLCALNRSGNICKSFFV